MSSFAASASSYVQGGCFWQFFFSFALTALPGETAPANKSKMRGLNNFIQDIRVCKDRDDEERRVNEEKANIRQKFSDTRKMTGYDRRKYVAKLMYIFLLGYDVDFGHLEALKLLADGKQFSRKQFGYLFLSLFLHESHEMVPLVIQSFLEDLNSTNEFFQSMALHAIGSIAGRDVAEAVSPVVERLAYTSTTPLAVRKKALACVVTLYRKRPDVFQLDQWPERLLQLLEAKSLSLVSSALTLLLEFATSNPAVFASCQAPAIVVLHRMTAGKYELDYQYYGVPAPWAQIVLMRYLMLYPPSSNIKADDALHDIMASILSTPAAHKAKNQRTINHKNSRNCVLFETIRLVIYYDTSDKLLDQTISLLGQMLKARQPNIRYLGLEAMSRLVASRDVQQLVREHQQTVIEALKDSDVSIRKRALDLLYGMCDNTTAPQIVRQLLDYLAKAEYEVRSELATKTALLAERFAANKGWYIDVMLELLSVAGEDVPDTMWHRVVRVVLSCTEDVQAYAARTCFKALRNPNWNEVLLKVGAYVLGEFGSLVSEERESGPTAQFEVLHNLWPFVSNQTRAVLLNSYAKFSFLYGADRELVTRIQGVFKYYAASIDEEIQQRSAEYYALLRLPNQSILERVLDAMPAFSDLDDDLAPAAADNYEPPIVDLMMPQGGGGNNNNNNSNATPQQQMMQQELQHRMAASPASGTGGGGGGFPQPVGGVVEPTPEAQAAHDGFYRQLWLDADGFLYRDERLQIGVKSQVQAGVFHIMLYFGNASGGDLNDFMVVAPTVDYLQIVTKAIAPVVPAGQQVSQLFSVGCLKEFVPSPVLQVTFTSRGQAYHVPLKLPVILTKYVVGATMDAGQYFGAWKQFAPEQNLEHQAVVKASQATVQSPFMADIVRRYGLTVLTGVDANPNNVVAAGNFVTVTGAATPILIRLEGNPQVNMVRVSVRAGTAGVAQTVGKFLGVQLQD
jgi:AP-2 complex subunit alpha